MEKNVYLRIESCFESLVINLHSIFAIKENIEKIRRLNETVEEADTKMQLNGIADRIDSLLLVAMKSERDKGIVEEFNRAKHLLFSVPIKILQDFQQALEQTNIDDFCIISHDGFNITLAGSFDFCYYHNVELKFLQVEFICCPNQFKADNFRIASDEERLALRSLVSGYEDTGLTFCMEDKTFGDKCYIVAHGIKVKWETVYYYKRENLKQDERIADWVEK